MKVECNSEGIDLAVKAIKDGNVIVFPTDTVYGMGCDPFNSKAVEKIYQLKKRQSDKFLPVLGYSKDELSTIAEFNKKHEKIISKFWPGPLTIITKITNEKLKKSLRLDDKIAIRVPNNNCILEILKECKLLVGTSANISGHGSFVDPQECFKQIHDVSLFVDGGKIISSGESTVIEIDDEIKIIREGRITKEELLEIL